MDAISAPQIVAAVASLLLGLSAGLFFAFQVAVMPGLAKVRDDAFVTTMNSINRVILNPPFLVVFVGALCLPALAAVASFVAGDGVDGGLSAAAAIVYLVGVLGVTGRVNVPLNDALAAGGGRAAFEKRWVRFNGVRAVASTVAFALELGALAH